MEVTFGRIQCNYYVFASNLFSTSYVNSFSQVFLDIKIISVILAANVAPAFDVPVLIYTDLITILTY